MSQPEIDGIFLDSAKFNAQKEIIERLLDNENLETKTDLDNPLRFACLNVIQKELSKYKLSISSNILSEFIIDSEKFLISKNRKGRLEYIQALQMLSQATQINNHSTNPLNPNQPIVK